MTGRHMAVKDGTGYRRKNIALTLLFIRHNCCYSPCCYRQGEFFFKKDRYVHGRGHGLTAYQDNQYYASVCSAMLHEMAAD